MVFACHNVTALQPPLHHFPNRFLGFSASKIAFFGDKTALERPLILQPKIKHYSQIKISTL